MQYIKLFEEYDFISGTPAYEVISITNLDTGEVLDINGHIKNKLGNQIKYSKKYDTIVYKNKDDKEIKEYINDIYSNNIGMYIRDIENIGIDSFINNNQNIETLKSIIKNGDYTYDQYETICLIFLDKFNLVPNKDNMKLDKYFIILKKDKQNWKRLYKKLDN